jgi:hypothetical protein
LLKVSDGGMGAGLALGLLDGFGLPGLVDGLLDGFVDGWLLEVPLLLPDGLSDGLLESAELDPGFFPQMTLGAGL